MNETQLQTLVAVLAEQRNGAMNAAANAAVENAQLKARITALERDLLLSQETAKHLEDGK